MTARECVDCGFTTTDTDWEVCPNCRAPFAEVELECVQDPAHCGGTVEFRMSLSPTGVNHPRCATHWAARLREQDRINRDYPDSPIPPAWFDPSAAGERWDSDY